MDFVEVPSFLAQLNDNRSTAARALEFTILNAARTSETLKADWTEIDLEKALWTIPAIRMKAAKEHRVPLSKPALALLAQLPSRRGPVFPGMKFGKPLSNMAMDMILRRMGIEVTVHGFRSSFRDWAGEMTNTPREVAEAALAHTVGNSAELAYRRGDALAKRRILMEDWGTYCGVTV
ncbi:tyrosine-type recombinase/integrase [Brevundimonas sp. SL161]|uniref:tyrosine-type recombinase/integrase n=1 Tax=Brevundimonas sp. SL161 TaxID=2804613 RepID=UPI003CEE1E53